MQIETLKIFCDVARLGSFSRSAEIHDVTQSSASQAVRSLEEGLGISLIDRTHRPWRLTTQGKVFHDGCRDLLERYDRLERSVRGHGADEGGEIRVASIYSAGLRHMREHVQAFSRAHPRVRVRLDYLHPDKVYEALAEARADVGLVSFPQARRELEIVPWRKEEMVVACPAGHPFAKHREIDPARLDGQTFVAFDRGLVIRREVDRFLKRRGAEVEVAMEFDNIEAIKQAVEIGSGLSLLPRPTLDREVQAGALAAVPLKGRPFHRPLGILLRRHRRDSSALEDFVEELQSPARTPAAARWPVGKNL